MSLPTHMLTPAQNNGSSLTLKKCLVLARYVPQIKLLVAHVRSGYTVHSHVRYTCGNYTCGAAPHAERHHKRNARREVDRFHTETKLRSRSLR